MRKKFKYIRSHTNSRTQFESIARAVYQYHKYVLKQKSPFSVQLRTDPVTGRAEIDAVSNGAIMQRYFLIWTPDVYGLDESALESINIRAEQMFREDYFYGVKDFSTMSAIVSSTLASYFGEENYPGVVKKAAAYWYKIATSQVFHNGNKRTALLSGLYMLNINDFDWWQPDGNELYEITKQIANHEISLSDLESIILDHIVIRIFASKKDAELNYGTSFVLNLRIDKNQN